MQRRQCVHDAVVIYRVGDIIGAFFYNLVSISHGNAGLNEFQHVDVIFTVAEGHGFFPLNLDHVQIFFDTRNFTAGIGNLWLNPYKQAATAAFYREISGTAYIPPTEPETEFL